MSDLTEALEDWTAYQPGYLHLTVREKAKLTATFADAARKWDNLTSPENVEKVAVIIDQYCFEIAEGVLFDEVARQALETLKGTE